MKTTRTNTRGTGEKKSTRHHSHRAAVSAIDHAAILIHTVCRIAGSSELVEEIHSDNDFLSSAIARRDTAAMFDWLMEALSFQGISDRVALGYMDSHGRASWNDIERRMTEGVNCPKLQSHWSFEGCRYDKTSRTCAEPDHTARCPLPKHDLRNGRLNQTAYSLFLFVCDVADGDLVGWIDRQIRTADHGTDPERQARMRDLLIEPLREVYGVSDKVLANSLSWVLMAAPREMHHWFETGASMIVVDTLVHNFLHRTGVLRRFDAGHVYGAACYRNGGCTEIIRQVAARIDARRFNPAYPRTFPRFVQHAIWRLCAQQELDVCNGNHIDDRRRCANVGCQLFGQCDRVCLQE